YVGGACMTRRSWQESARSSDSTSIEDKTQRYSKFTVMDGSLIEAGVNNFIGIPISMSYHLDNIRDVIRLHRKP
ncbi:MAG: hypothetical protein ACKO96_23160, partial [Flammeovirgaceae bacterium]